MIIKLHRNMIVPIIQIILINKFKFHLNGTKLYSLKVEY